VAKLHEKHEISNFAAVFCAAAAATPPKNRTCFKPKFPTGGDSRYAGRCPALLMSPFQGFAGADCAMHEYSLCNKILQKTFHITKMQLLHN
jgi:hypothetical protein